MILRTRLDGDYRVCGYYCILMRPLADDSSFGFAQASRARGAGLFSFAIEISIRIIARHEVRAG